MLAIASPARLYNCSVWRSGRRRNPGVRCWLRGRSRLLPRRALLLRRRLPIALLQVREHDRGDELLLPVIVEFDRDVLVVAGKHGSESEFPVFNLSAGGVSGFVGHRGY